ncbi:H/ACA ribonucleoprotein complex non-core subunit NAF1-like [Biomphalaria glabrata]|uniref:H/ACA ribonucleoprotein complex non-core subunit NAF1 n=1 Tax=Biomphalaria glabrata TaxID=6526 RepID=A0A9W2ZSS6_BIOGL|nr:H/ACA ribonucleoprotein complex non-core subunit NAF1-like [Biomphalaria glabrata]XP_055877933.1 H/ACA ribonucleoprotein complex non-core subunit NAF1-like [Biomphalaria glabrata]
MRMEEIAETKVPQFNEHKRLELTVDDTVHSEKNNVHLEGKIQNIETVISSSQNIETCNSSQNIETYNSLQNIETVSNVETVIDSEQNIETVINSEQNIETCNSSQNIETVINSEHNIKTVINSEYNIETVINSEHNTETVINSEYNIETVINSEHNTETCNSVQNIEILHGVQNTEFTDSVQNTGINSSETAININKILGKGEVENLNADADINQPSLILEDQVTQPDLSSEEKKELHQNSVASNLGLDSITACDAMDSKEENGVIIIKQEVEDLDYERLSLQYRGKSIVVYSDTDSDTESSDCSPNVTMAVEEDGDEEFQDTFPKKQSENLGTKKFVSRTEGEVLPEELPPLEYLTISPDENVELEPLGTVSGIVGVLVVIKALPDSPALFDDTVLFLEGRRPLGLIFETFGTVHQPYYSVRFNRNEDIRDQTIELGHSVYFAPKASNLTKYVFISELRKIKFNDASWEHDNEPPPSHLEFSDDEEEKKAKRQRNQAKKSDNPVLKGQKRRRGNAQSDNNSSAQENNGLKLMQGDLNRNPFSNRSQSFNEHATKQTSRENTSNSKQWPPRENTSLSHQQWQSRHNSSSVSQQWPPTSSKEPAPSFVNFSLPPPFPPFNIPPPSFNTNPLLCQNSTLPSYSNTGPFMGQASAPSFNNPGLFTGHTSTPSSHNTGPFNSAPPPHNNTGPFNSAPPSHNNTGPFNSAPPPHNNTGPFNSAPPSQSSTGPFNSAPSHNGSGPFNSAPPSHNTFSSVSPSNNTGPFNMAPPFNNMGPLNLAPPSHNNTGVFSSQMFAPSSQNMRPFLGQMSTPSQFTPATSSPYTPPFNSFQPPPFISSQHTTKHNSM